MSRNQTRWKRTSNGFAFGDSSMLTRRSFEPQYVLRLVWDRRIIRTPTPTVPAPSSYPPSVCWNMITWWFSMKCSLVAVFLVSTVVAAAQDRPTAACQFGGFDTSQKREPHVAETPKTSPITAWIGCDAKGCIREPVDPDSPVLIYSTEDAWTCGYYADRRGAGPAWIRSSQLRPQIRTAPSPGRLGGDLDRR